MPKTEALARLRTENAALKRERSALQEQVAQLSAVLAAAQARISELEATKTPPPAFVKANAPARPKQPRKKRAPEHNHARRRETQTQIVEHHLQRCPQCQGRLSGAHVGRRRQVVDLQHLAALKTVKSLVPGYGWQRTSAIMQAIHRGDLSAALAIIGEHHAEQARKRLQVEQTLFALQILAAPSEALHYSKQPQPVWVREAATQAGVRVSAVHFWEQQGLLHPLREPHSRYQPYDEHQIRRLRVVARLRDAGYPFTVIQSVLDELAAGRPEKAIMAVEKRREEQTRTCWSCLEALTSFQHHVSEFGPQHRFAPR